MYMFLYMCSTASVVRNDSSEGAQQRFAGAKSISSDQYFDKGGRAVSV